MRFTEEHHAIRETVAQFIEKEINPYTEEWGKEGIFPAHEVFKKMGNLGLLGIARPVEFGGMRSSDTAQVFFDDVRVPQRKLIGEEGKGFIYQMLQFQEQRLFAAAGGVKGMEKCIQETIEYTREREIFGQSVLDNQVVHFCMAELQTEIEALRALIYDAVEGYIDGTDVTIKGSMAKLKVGRLQREVTDAYLQYWGGNGFMWDNPIARAYRDTRLTSIGGGADEVMLSIICKMMATPLSRKK